VLTTRRGLLWLAVAVVVGLGVGIGVRALGVLPYRVTSGSMAPTVNVGEWLVVTKAGSQARRQVRLREIVLFRYPLGTTGRAVKRVVAVGGDTVAFTDRYVSVNGRTTPIAGSPPDLGSNGEPTGQHQPRRVVHVPDGHVFLLGDNSAVSIDSRSFGPVPVSELVGRVRFVFPAPAWWSVAAFVVAALALCGVVLAAISAVGWPQPEPVAALPADPEPLLVGVGGSQR